MSERLMSNDGSNQEFSSANQSSSVWTGIKNRVDSYLHPQTPHPLDSAKYEPPKVLTEKDIKNRAVAIISATTFAFGGDPQASIKTPNPGPLNYPPLEIVDIQEQEPQPSTVVILLLENGDAIALNDLATPEARAAFEPLVTEAQTAFASWMIEHNREINGRVNIQIPAVRDFQNMATPVPTEDPRNVRFFGYDSTLVGMIQNEDGSQKDIDIYGFYQAVGIMDPNENFIGQPGGLVPVLGNDGVLTIFNYDEESLTFTPLAYGRSTESEDLEWEGLVEFKGFDLEGKPIYEVKVIPNQWEGKLIQNHSGDGSNEVFEPGIIRTERFEDVRVIGNITRVYQDETGMWMAEATIGNETASIILGKDNWVVGVSALNVDSNGIPSIGQGENANLLSTPDVVQYLQQNPGVPFMLDYDSELAQELQAVVDNPDDYDPLYVEISTAAINSDTYEFLESAFQTAPGQRYSGSVGGKSLLAWEMWLPMQASVTSIA